MTKQELTFNDLPYVVHLLVSEISELVEIVEIVNDLQERVKDLEERIPSQEVEDLLSIQEASVLLNLTVTAIYDKVSKKDIPYMKRGKRLYFSKADLMTYSKLKKQ